MPGRQSRSTAKRATKQQPATKQQTTKERRHVATPTRPGTRRTRPTAVKVKSSWKPVSKPTKNLVLHTFDAGVKLLTHKCSDDMYTDVHDAFIDARNQVAVSLETLRVPPSKHDYNHLSTTLVNLKEMKKQLEQRQSTLNETLDKQEKELQTLENEKVYLQDFGKFPGKHHPLLVEPMEDELHLNFNTIK